MKRMIFSAALVAGAAMLMGAGSAAAETKITGKLQIVGVRPGSGNNYLYVVPEHSTTVTTIRYCVTSDDTIAMVAQNALEENLTVYMRCSYSDWSNNYGGYVQHLNVHRSL